jgi:hypothetical protein
MLQLHLLGSLLLRKINLFLLKGKDLLDKFIHPQIGAHSAVWKEGEVAVTGGHRCFNFGFYCFQTKTLFCVKRKAL